jgi:Cu/Ag efflux protein CusF
MTKLTTLFAIASVMLLTSCSKQEQAQPPADTMKAVATAVKEGQGKAIVRAIDTATKSITLDHNTIPNIMDAMTMEYPVSDSAALHEVAVGDSVTFTLQDRGEGNYVVTNIIPMPNH